MDEVFGDTICQDMSSILKQCSWGQPSIWAPPIQQQMRRAGQCIGIALWGVKCWAKWGDGRYCHLCHATNAVGSDILGVPSSTTTPNRIHLSAQPHHLILHCFTGSSWKWPASTTNLQNNSLHKNMRSCLSISSGLPNYQFHQTQEKFKKLGTYSFAQVPSCCLASACHQLPSMAFWGENLKTSALILVQWEHFAGPS